MEKSLFCYDDGIKMDKEIFEQQFFSAAEAELSIKETLPRLKKIFFLSDWTSLHLMKEALLEVNFSIEEIEETLWMYENDDWRGLCFYKYGIIAINMMEVMNSSDYYCTQNPLMGTDDFLKFIMTDSRMKDISDYTHDHMVVRQLIFWKTLFHEIRHVEQYHHPERMTSSDDEKDADWFGVYMYKEIIEPAQKSILTLDFEDATSVVSVK